VPARELLACICSGGSLQWRGCGARRGPCLVKQRALDVQSARRARFGLSGAGPRAEGRAGWHMPRDDW
jgi:hypothetical protein